MSTQENSEQNRFYFLMCARISIFYCRYEKGSGVAIWKIRACEEQHSDWAILNHPWGTYQLLWTLQIHNGKVNLSTKEEI